MVATRPGDDPTPRAGEGGPRRTTAQLAADPAFTGTYEQMATPLLRRRHLPTVVDALSILGEVPTVTFATSTTIASGTTTGVKRLGNVTGADGDLAGDPTFLIGGTTGMPANAASPSNRVRAAIVTGGTSTATRYVPTFNFYTDASAFEVNVVFPGSTFDYRLVVDGKLSITNGTLTPGAGSGYVKFDFTTAKTRHIALTINDPDFLGVRVPTTYSAWRPSQPFARRLFAVGDSITRGTQVQPTQPWCWDLGRLLGCDDVWNAGMGGTGWATDGSGTTRFSDRVTTDIAPTVGPNDVVVFFGSRNDPSGNAGQLAAIQAAVTSTTALVAACKNVFVGSNMTVINTMAASVVTGAQAAGRTGIDASGWITGTGNVGATNNSGNADRYISADGVHPVLAGYLYIAQRFNSAIRAVLPG